MNTTKWVTFSNLPEVMTIIKDFLSASHIRAPELGPPAILATIDMTLYTITEELVRSRLQADDGGVADLPIPDIYSGMDNLGYVPEGKLTFFKNKFSPQWRFLVHTLLHRLSTKSGSWDQFGSPIAIALICLSAGRHFNWFNYIFRGMVSNIGNAKKFLMYLRFLQTILGIETRVATQYKVLAFSSKLFANMQLNFAGHPMQLLPAMLLQAQAGGGAEVAEQVIPHPMPSPDHSPAPLPTPSKPQTSNLVAQVLEHDHRSNQHEPATGSFPSRDDAPLGGDFHPSPPRSSHAPLRYIPWKQISMIIRSFLRMSWGMAADSDIPSGHTSHVPAASPCAPPAGPTGTSKVPRALFSISPGAFDAPTGALNVSAAALAVPADSPKVPSDSPKVPAVVPTDSPYIPAGVSSKGKSIMVEEDIPVKARRFRQMEEDRLGEEAAKWLHEEKIGEIERERAEAQRKRQQEVLESGKFYNEADWLNIKAQVEANASLSKTLLGDEVTKDNFPAHMAAGKSLGRKPMHKPKSTLPTLDLDAPAQTFLKVVTDENSDDEDSVDEVWSAVVGWEVLSTPLGAINALYHIDGTTKHFSTLRQILHMGDLQVLSDSQAGGKGSCIWNNQNQVFNSPMLYLLRVEMVINSPWIMPILGIQELASPKANGFWYVVTTGRVIVSTGRYIVPTGRVIVPTGRVIVPTGRYVVPAGKCYS
nr:ribonuclease H-like domain-containing protein [Tanacetum cinerariifolium]